MVCAHTQVDELYLFKEPVMVDLVLLLMTEKGDFTEYYYNSSLFIMTPQFKMVLPGGGGGKLEKNKIVMPGRGVPVVNQDSGQNCFVPYCPSENLTYPACKKTIEPDGYNGNQIINVLIEILYPTRENWSVIIKPFPLDNPRLGSKSKIWKRGNDWWIYQSSLTWHTYVMVGKIKLSDTIGVTWLNNTVLSRPGRGTCKRGFSCPTKCTTGVYNEALVLDPDSGLIVSMFLDNDTSYNNLAIGLFNNTNELARYSVPWPHDYAFQSVIQCIKYYKQIWCFGAQEIVEPDAHNVDIKGFTFKLPVTCVEEVPSADESGKDMTTIKTESTLIPTTGKPVEPTTGYTPPATPTPIAEPSTVNTANITS